MRALNSLKVSLGLTFLASSLVGCATAPIAPGSTLLSELVSQFGKPAKKDPVKVLTYVTAKPIGNPVVAWTLNASDDRGEIVSKLELGNPVYERKPHQTGMLSGFSLFETGKASVIFNSSGVDIVPSHLLPKKPTAPKKLGTGQLLKVAEGTPADLDAALGTGEPMIRDETLSFSYLGIADQLGISFRTVTVFYPLTASSGTVKAQAPLIKLAFTDLKGKTLLSHVAGLTGAKSLTAGKVLKKVGKSSLIQITGAKVKITGVRYGQEGISIINIHRNDFDAELLATSG